MAQYTTLSSEELAEIVSHFAIGKPLNCEEMSGGFGNSNYKLTTTDGTYLLKICDEKSLEELQTQNILLEHLREYAYPTVYPIIKKNGDVLHITKNYYVMIYPFLEGGTPKPSPRVLSQIGEALAKLHCISPLDVLPSFPMGMAQITPFLEEVHITEFATHPFVIWLQSELDWIVPELDKPLPKGLLHGDLFLDNTLFDGQQMVAILDFEEGCHDTFLIDVGMTIIGCCYTDEHQLNLGALHSFLDAYNATRSLSDSEWKSIDCYVYYAALSIAFWRFRQFNVRYPHTNLSGSYQEMIIRASNWESIY